MKILCAKSGIKFSCDHVPGTLYDSRELSHPIFHLKQKRLLALTAKWAGKELTPTDEYLLYLAWFNSTSLVEFRVPAQQTKDTESICNSYMERLAKIVTKITSDFHPTLHAAKLIVTPDTKDLSNSHIWIQTWEKNYQDFEDGYKEFERKEGIHNWEIKLEKNIKDQNRNPDKYARIMSIWASQVGKFPQEQITHPLTFKQVKLTDYWQEIICRCSRDERIFEIDKSDIMTLYEFCEVSIPGGSIYHHALLQMLRYGMERRTAYLDLGDIDALSNRYTILDPNASVEDANKLSIINNAPTELPRIESYPNKFAFLKAKLAYQMAMRYKQSKEDSIAALETTVAAGSKLEAEDAAEELSEDDEEIMRLTGNTGEET